MFLANAFDQSCDLGEAAIVGFVCVVVYGQDVAVQVGGAEDCYLNSIRRKAVRGEDQSEDEDQRGERINER